MANGADLTYYRRRETQERASAARASDEMTRRLHLQMADRYAYLTRLMTLSQPPEAA
jgi:hypothetical protein